MILNGIKNQRVELKIIRDKSLIDTTYDDSEWLRIYIDVHSNLGNWHTVDESLMVSEFKELIKWFKDLSINDKVEYPELYFTEPNLEFHLLEDENGIKKIKMIFNAESKPKSATKDDQYFVEFEFSSADLSKIADDLEKEL